MLIVGICIALFFSLLFAHGNVAYRNRYPRNILFFGVFAVFVTASHLVIANLMGWSVFFPREARGLILVPYLLGILLWGTVLGDILILRKYPELAKRIFVALVGKGA